MGTSLAASSIFSPQVIVLAPIISFALVLALFGFYTLLFGLSFHLLRHAKNISHQKLHLSWMLSLFLVSSVGGMMNAASNIDDLVFAYNAIRTQDFARFLKFITQDPAETVMTGFSYICLVLANTVADSVIIHRIYLVWGSKLWIIILPAIVSLAINAVGLASAIMRTIGFPNGGNEAIFELELKGVNYGLGFFYANATLNMVLTMMIAGRIWWVARQISTCFGQNGVINAKYKDIIAVLVECGFLYPIALIAHAVVEGNQSRIAIPVDLTGPVILLAGIAPTLIILSTCIGRKLGQRVIDSQGTATTGTPVFQGGVDSIQNISSFMQVAHASQDGSTLNPGQNTEVEIEMKRIIVEV
ncbi:hypothetical protein BDP27DRAFT_1423794 [Rhodocollybia butyracea]|uniref:Uncharacterized protein n=1 Tax=Rhodocollybia butyracea TaxID=206335 RepID=A0A9P5PJA8_9AGAR|nr:hypothetical protein BDP27DRAFT_1423794 [Rhodocollybia butyracea]